MPNEERHERNRPMIDLYMWLHEPIKVENRRSGPGWPIEETS